MDGDIPEIKLIDVEDSRANADLSSKEQSPQGREASRWAREGLIAVAFLRVGMIIGGTLLSGDSSGDGRQDSEPAAPDEEIEIPTTQAAAPTTGAPTPTPAMTATNADLTEPAASVMPARYLIPGATADVVWAIDDAINTATPIDMLTGQAGNEIELGDGIGWVSAAVVDGFIVNPLDGPLAYWTPNAPMTPISLPVPEQSGIHAVAGNILIVVSPGDRISALDITTDTLIDVFIDIGDGLVSDVCMSPTQRYAVVVGSTGRSVVIDFEQGEVIAQLPAAKEFQAVGWTSDTQLVYIAADRLVATNVVNHDRHEIAEIDPLANWSVAGSAAMC